MMVKAGVVLLAPESALLPTPMSVVASHAINTNTT